MSLRHESKGLVIAVEGSHSAAVKFGEEDR